MWQCYLYNSEYIKYYNVIAYFTTVRGDALNVDGVPGSEAINSFNQVDSILHNNINIILVDCGSVAMHTKKITGSVDRIKY